MCAHGLNMRLPAFFLDLNPGFFLIDVPVGFVGQFHDAADGRLVIPAFKIGGDVFAGCRNCLEFRLRKFVRESAVEPSGNKAGAAAGNIDDLADHVGIYALHKVFEVQIDVGGSCAKFCCK